MKHSRRDENQAIKPIQQPPVARNQPRSVFQTEIALNRREHQVAKLANDTDNEAETNQTNWVIERGVSPNEMSDHCHERRGQNDRAECSANGFVWTRVRNKFSMTKKMTADVSKDIV